MVLVAPNIAKVEAALGVVPSDFRLWVALHERIHQPEARSRPLAGRQDGRIAGQLMVTGTDTPSPRRGGSLVGAFLTVQQREVLDRLSAEMALLEGHADVMMDNGTATVRTSRSFAEGSTSDGRGVAGWPSRTGCLGMDLKLAQWEGAAFCRAVIEKVGWRGSTRRTSQQSSCPAPVRSPTPTSGCDGSTADGKASTASASLAVVQAVSALPPGSWLVACSGGWTHSRWPGLPNTWRERYTPAGCGRGPRAQQGRTPSHPARRNSWADGVDARVVRVTVTPTGAGLRRTPARRGTCAGRAPVHQRGRSALTPRRPGRDRASWSGPRLRGPLAGGNAPGQGRVRQATVGSRARGHGVLLRGAGSHPMARPAQRGPTIRPGQGSHPGHAGAGGRTRPRRPGIPGAHGGTGARRRGPPRLPHAAGRRGGPVGSLARRPDPHLRGRYIREWLSRPPGGDVAAVHVGDR